MLGPSESADLERAQSTMQRLKCAVLSIENEQAIHAADPALLDVCASAELSSDAADSSTSKSIRGLLVDPKELISALYSAAAVKYSKHAMASTATLKHTHSGAMLLSEFHAHATDIHAAIQRIEASSRGEYFSIC